MRPALAVAVALAVSCPSLVACGGDEPAPRTRPIAAAGRVAIAIDLPADPGAALALAGDDLADALAGMTGATRRAPDDLAGAAATIVVVVDPDALVELGPEGHRQDTRGATLTLTAATQVGAAYALWGLAWELGVRWIHPDEAFVPDAPAATLAWDRAGVVDRPDFVLRGFHEHTQHPIPLSDTILRPDFPGGREAVTRTLRWLARNRQNFLSFHLLNTVDLAAWAPWVRGIADEAHALGVDLGVVLSFADQQQHGMKLIRPEAVDEHGAPLDEPTQIAAGLDAVLAGGMRHVIFQIGTSEFTSPDPAIARLRLDAAVAHLAARHPDVNAHAWVHITCGLEDEAGRSFFHVPLDADPRLGAFVHTTMFYTLGDPAPVYDCADFAHQVEFLTAADGQRRQTFFPESAWWLGFDNNVPLLLPLTGWSRAADIATVRGHAVSGHVTFSTGREWTYWQYDHFVARAGWRAELGWDAYLEGLAPLYGAEGETVAAVLRDWTELQRQHLYVENPEIYFYLAGELPQDEIGAAAGVLARRPKLPFKAVRDMDAAAFAAWEARDLALLGRMHDAYAALLARLPEAPAAGSDATARRYREVRRAAWVFVERLAHAIALYEGAAALRGADAAARPVAEAALARARAITTAVHAELVAAEVDYREPVAWLARPKPDSLTAYPYGYLYETSTAYFWTRRDDQLAALIASTYDGDAERWPVAPLALFRAPPDTTTLVTPDDPVASQILLGFVPGIALAVTGPLDGGEVPVALAPDRDDDGQPDVAPLPLVAAVADGALTASAAAWILPVVDQADQRIGDLVLRDATLSADVTVVGTALTAVPRLVVAGEVVAAELLGMIRAYVGIDEEGLATLVKSIWHLDAAAPLPERLPFAIALSPVVRAVPAGR